MVKPSLRYLSSKRLLFWDTLYVSCVMCMLCVTYGCAGCVYVCVCVWVCVCVLLYGFVCVSVFCIYSKTFCVCLFINMLEKNLFPTPIWKSEEPSTVHYICMNQKLPEQNILYVELFLQSIRCSNTNKTFHKTLA